VLSDESVSETLTIEEKKEPEDTEATLTLTTEDQPDAPQEVRRPGLFNPADLWSLGLRVCVHNMASHVSKPVITQVLTETIGGAVQVDLSARELSDAQRDLMQLHANPVKVCCWLANPCCCDPNPSVSFASLSHSFFLLLNKLTSQSCWKTFTSVLFSALN
jgi:hypothetical protein